MVTACGNIYGRAPRQGNKQRRVSVVCLLSWLLLGLFSSELDALHGLNVRLARFVILSVFSEGLPHSCSPNCFCFLSLLLKTYSFYYVRFCVSTNWES